MNKQFTIPAPLKAGEVVRWSSDGTIRFYNPDWYKKLSEPVNAEFMDAVSSSLITDENQMDSEKVTCSFCISVGTITQLWPAARIHYAIHRE